MQETLQQINNSSTNNEQQITKTKDYKNVESRLFTPTKSALGKYGSRYSAINDTNNQLKNNTPISPVLNKKYKEGNQYLRHSLIQNKSSSKLNNKTIVNNKSLIQNSKSISQTPTPSTNTNQNTKNITTSQFNSNCQSSRTITPMKQRTTSNIKQLNKSSLQHNSIIKKQLDINERVNDSKTTTNKKILEYQREFTQNSITNSNIKQVQTTNSNIAKGRISITPLKATSYQSKLQHTYQNKNPLNKSAIKQQVQILDSQDMKDQQIILQKQQITPIVSEYQNKYYKPKTIIHSRKVSINGDDVVQKNEVRTTVPTPQLKEDSTKILDLRYKQLLQQRENVLSRQQHQRQNSNNSTVNKSKNLDLQQILNQTSLNNDDKYKSENKNLSEYQRSKSQLNVRKVPLIEILKLTDRSSQNTDNEDQLNLSTAEEKRKSDVHGMKQNKKNDRIIYQFKDIVY